jgi:hypothetical protein
LQDASPGRVSNGVENTVERYFGRHGGVQIARKLTNVNVRGAQPPAAAIF